MSDLEFMKEALDEARAGMREGEVPIGSVVVRDGDIIARGHNRRRQNDDPTAHAEIECLRALGNVEDAGNLTLYSTLEPCPMCAGAILQIGIGRVIWGEKDLLYGACGTALNLFADTEVAEECGLLRDEIRKVMLDFFAKEEGKPTFRWFDILLPDD